MSAMGLIWRTATHTFYRHVTLSRIHRWHDWACVEKVTQDKMLTLLSKRMRQQLALTCSISETRCSRASSLSSAVLQKPHLTGITQHPRQYLDLTLNENPTCIYIYIYGCSEIQRVQHWNRIRQEKPCAGFDYHIYTQSCLACLSLFRRCLGVFEKLQTVLQFSMRLFVHWWEFMKSKLACQYQVNPLYHT